MSVSVSVVVPTRNRAEHAVACAVEILKSNAFLELVVVDQSDDDQTETGLNALGDPRLRCVRSKLRGATSGRNVGIEQTRGDVVAFTDDDCRVTDDWVESIARVFDTDPAVAVVCGRVTVPEELRNLGVVATFEPLVREWQGRFPPPDADWGISANMSIRRDVFAGVGAFDPLLGPGAPLRCGEEPDILFRVLRAGLKVVNAKEVRVDHLGVRPAGKAASKLAQDYAAGTGAAFMKHIRLRDTDAMRIYLAHLSGCGKLLLINALHLHRPIGLGYTLAFLSGSLASIAHPVDPKSGLYIRT